MQPARTTLAALSIFAILFTMLTLSDAFAQNQQNSMAQWEYAELSVQGDQAILVQQDFYDVLNRPSQTDPGGSSVRTKTGRRYWQTSVVILHLNTLGNNGWEIYSSYAVKNGEKYLLRRLR